MEADMADLEKFMADIEAVLEYMIAQQRVKVVDVALDILPHLTPEDVKNPQDYPEIAEDATFNFEDGLLAGLMSARMALRSQVFNDHRATPS
jgi:hypothetical protein